jgi:hypothetical protein
MTVRVRTHDPLRADPVVPDRGSLVHKNKYSGNLSEGIFVLFEFCLRTAQIFEIHRDIDKACVLRTSN